MDDMERKLTMGYGEPALRAAFDKVKNKDHWKLEIRAVIPATELDVTSAAVSFYTGSALQVMRQFKNGRVRVWAAGYYAAVGS